MNNFLNRMGQRFRQFMVGRYGVDNLSRFLMLLAVAAMVINLFIRNLSTVVSLILRILVWALLILVYWRMLSKNTQARYRENTRYLQFRERLRNKFKGGSDSTHRIFRCPHCRQRVRVPRGRGMIEITCPRCRKSFAKRS